MSFWAELFVNLAGNAVLGSLLVYLGKIYLDRINRNEQAVIDEKARADQAVINEQARADQARLDERMKDIEQKYEQLKIKDEHFHQISQQSYQKLFDKKVEVYSQLMSVSHSIKTAYPHIDHNVEKKLKNNQDIGSEGILLSIRAIYANKKYEEFRQLIDKNLAVLSADLLVVYFAWMDVVNAKMQENSDFFLVETSELMEKATQEIQDNPNQDQLALVSKFAEEQRKYLEYKKKLKTTIIYNNSFVEFERIINQIRSDIQIINKKIDLAMA